VSLVTQLQHQHLRSRPYPQRWRPPRRRRVRLKPQRRLIAVLLGIVAMSLAAVAAWVLAGGNLVGLPAPLSEWLPPTTPIDAGDEGTAPVQVASTPSGAEVRIDGIRRGQTPAVLGLSPGTHELILRHPNAIGTVRSIDVPAEGTDLTVSLWRRQPDILPLRPVYPGASLVDARFVADGTVALSVSLPGESSAAQPQSARELWQLDPVTGSLARLTLSDPAAARAPLVALAPDGQQVAYLIQGSAGAPASLWPATGGAPVRDAASRPATVWLTTRDNGVPPRKLFGLPHTLGASATDTEQLVDLVWTPDSAHLVAITRVAGNPARSRVFLIDAAGTPETSDPSAALELLLLPAEIVPASASADPTGRWLTFLAHSTTTSSAANGLTLCALELRPNGQFRDLADLGSDERRPTTAPVAWTPTIGGYPTSQLAFVKPVPSASPSSGGLFDLFGALRTSAPASGLFVLDLDASGVQATQPRRLGKLTGVVAPVWREDGTLLSFVRQNDGALALRAIDSDGAVDEPGAPLPVGAIQGAGVAARWDTAHGRVLLLSRPATTNANAASGAPLQAWLVSYIAAPQMTP
jgi:hypothetical protein